MSSPEPASSPSIPADPLAPDSRIVVGVDESAYAASALRWALREGALRRAVVEVVHVWRPPLASLPFGATFAIPVDEAELDATARKALDQVVDQALAALGDPLPEVVRTTVPGSAAPTLIDIAGDADLLVVGSRGRGELRQLVLGSVAHACVQHAACPVVVVRPPRRD
jgi:nucleotide-binding universal stress UspA family protein